MIFRKKKFYGESTVVEGEPGREKPVKARLRIGRLILIPLALVLVLSLLSNSLVVTRQDEYTVIKQFGAVVRVEEKAGPSFKIPFIQSTQTIPKTLMLYDLAVSDVITSDKKSMIADCFVTWHVTDPNLFIRTLSANIANAEFRIDTVVYNSLKTTISSMTQEEIISGRDGRLAEAILANCDDTFSQYGIDITAIETKTLDMPAENKAAVYERMISEREKIAAEYRANGEYEAQKTRNNADKEVDILLSEAEAQATVIRAEGDAAYMNILAEAYNTPEKAEFYTFMISLDAARESLSGDSKTLILDENSPLTQIFYSGN
ncbi:MAG: protease modulator HflC [Oscillospiraceae bacterium]|nr:protease modulator HflC [Oscillospiraceae bacterium]